MKIIFDSNVWRHVASPEKFPSDPFYEAYIKIKQFIVERKVEPCISETIFTIEAIQRKARKDFISKYRPKVVFTEDIGDSKIKTTNVMKSSGTPHPGNHPILAEHLRDAMSIGFKIIRCPRIAGIINPEIENLRFIMNGKELREYHEKLFEVGEKIEKKGAGFDHIKNIGEKYDAFWFDGINKAPKDQWGYIANAMAEWADGDSVAISIALGCDYMCTRDEAKKAGANSVFSEKNLTWLKDDYGFETITPDLLVKKIG